MLSVVIAANPKVPLWYANKSERMVVWESGLVTTMAVGPQVIDLAGVVQVIEVGLATVTPVQATPATVTVAPD